MAETCETPVETAAAWTKDCQHWRGRILYGKYWHWCPDWDYLPIDETCLEWPCVCADESGWPPNPCISPARADTV